MLIFWDQYDVNFSAFFFLIVLNLEHFKALGGLVFVCSLFIHTLWFALYFFFYTTLTLLNPFNECHLGVLPKFQANQKVYEDNEQFE